MRHQSFPAASALALAISLVVATPLPADVDAAKGYLKEAQELAERKDNDGASAKLELAEAELDGVDAAAKRPVAESIKALRQTIAGAANAANAQKYKRKLDSLMRDAESAIGNQVTWPGVESELNELFENPDAAAALPDEIAAAKKKFATFSKLNKKKNSAVVAQQVAEAMKDLDAKWAEAKPKFTDPDASPNSKSGAVDDMTRALEEIQKQIANLDPDSDAAKTYAAHVEKIGAEFTQIALADKAKEVLARLKDSFESYKEEYEGWEAEAGAGPSWNDYKKNRSQAMSAFAAPKTKGLISRTEYFLKNLADNEDYKQVAASPDVAKFVKDLTANLEKARKQMLAHVNPLVAAALKTSDAELDMLKDDVRNALGEESEESKAFQESIQKRIDATAGAAAAAEEASKAWYKQMSEAAAAAWPDMAAKLHAEEGFDPNNYPAFKGKTIKITTDNLMGYRFKPGDFEFATTLSGIPVAAHFDAAIAPAVKAIEAKLGRALGDNDDDGRWEIYAVVTGNKGRMMQRKTAEGDVKVNGTSVGTVTAEYADPVDAPIITIIAAKCGPLAVAKGIGTLRPDGTVAK